MHCMAFKIGKWNIEGPKVIRYPGFQYHSSFAVMVVVMVMLYCREKLDLRVQAEMLNVKIFELLTK